VICEQFVDAYTSLLEKPTFHFRDILENNEYPQFLGSTLSIKPIGGKFLLFQNAALADCVFNIEITFSDGSAIKIEDHDHTEEDFS